MLGFGDVAYVVENTESITGIEKKRWLAGEVFVAAIDEQRKKRCSERI